MDDFAERRETMVDTQVRPSDVTKYPVIAAMLAVPREVFLPEARREAAYLGGNLEVGPDRVMVEARTLGKLLDALDLGPDDRVLVLGSGYAAAVAGRIAGKVTHVEEDAWHAGHARAAMERLGLGNVTLLEGPMADGAPQAGPYDVILIEGGVETIPAALSAQLAPGGRIGALFMEGALGTARLGRETAGRLSWRNLFNATAPVLPGFAAMRKFVL